MEKNDLSNLMAREELCLIANLAERFRVEAYLVGGCLRDHILGREKKDLDFALSGACEELSRSFAERIRGAFFWLDEERVQARVVKKCWDGMTVYDFAPLAGPDIEKDLCRRDFTINALAMELRALEVELIDPLHGRDDLRNGVIRACGPASFDDDPLRLMRAIRFSAELGFAIEERSWQDLCARASLLKKAASERIRDELFRILATPGCGPSLLRLGASGLWPVISPLPAQESFEERVPLAEKAEQLCSEAGLAVYLDREVEGGVTVRSLVKLAALLDGSENGGVANVAERLRLGREAGRILEILCRDEGRTLDNLERIGAERSMFRFFRDREPAGPGILIAARIRESISATVYSRLLHYFLMDYNPGAEDLFLSGGEVMGILEVPPGKAVGNALARLREAEASGSVNSREEAREFVKNLLTNEEAIG
jgi:poly(A) polymerase